MSYPRRSTDAPSIVRLEDGVYQPPDDGFPVAVTEAEDCLLQTFLRWPAQRLGDLVMRSGIPAAAKTLARLALKYDGRFKIAMHLPGGNGRGGYAVHVQDVVQQRSSIAPPPPDGPPR